MNRRKRICPIECKRTAFFDRCSIVACPRRKKASCVPAGHVVHYPTQPTAVEGCFKTQPAIKDQE